jgi:hypothetical protein
MPTRLAPQSTFAMKSGFKNRGGDSSKDQGGMSPKSGKDSSKGGKDSFRASGGLSSNKDQGDHSSKKSSSDASQVDSRSGSGKPAAEKPSPAKPAMSEEDTKKKAKGIIEEFHNLYDYKEVSECAKELSDKNAKLGLVLQYWIEDLLEGKKRSVEKFRKLVVELGTSGLVKKDDFEEGLLQIICTLEDLEIDVPKAPAIVAEIFGDLVANKLVSMEILGKRLTKAFEEFVGEKVEDLFGETEVYQDFALALHKSLILRDQSLVAGKAMQLKEVEQEFTQAGIQLKPFAPEKIEKYGCQSIFSHITYKRHVMQSLKDGADPAFLANWFEMHVDPKAVKTNTKLGSSTLAEVLQRALAESEASTSKINGALNLKEELPMVTDSEHGIHKLFNKVVDKGNLNAEFDCVLALQLVNHHLGAPKGLMTRLLTDFYYSDVLTEDAFNKWRDDNKDETPGKVKAISDSAMWLNDLAEMDEEDES